eukprot:8363973-Pyramimonas_sp.AAC.1
MGTTVMLIWEDVDFVEALYTSMVTITTVGYADSCVFTRTEGNFTWAEGNFTRAEGNFTRAEGSFTRTEGSFTRTEGSFTRAKGNFTRTEGNFTRAEGGYAPLPLLARWRSEQLTNRSNVVLTGGRVRCREVGVTCKEGGLVQPATVDTSSSAHN